MTENIVVSEDWESECYDSPGCSEAVHVPSTAILDVCGLTEQSCCEHDDVSEFKLSLCENVESELSDMTEHDTNKPAYVTDKKKVFVSNVNYRVRLHISCV